MHSSMARASCGVSTVSLGPLLVMASPYRMSGFCIVNHNRLSEPYL